MKTYVAPPARPAEPLPATVKRRRPRSYPEWKALRRWRTLPAWEETPVGYLLRLAREDAGVTQVEMGRRLNSSQQAVAQAERWESNPSMRFAREWARALGLDLAISLLP